MAESGIFPVMKIPVRVYYEDTDCGGVVYYANYLRYFERARTEYLRSLAGLHHEKDVIFVVRRAEAEYLGPCRYDDLLEVETVVAAVTGATVTFGHAIRKDGDDRELVRGRVTLACVGADGRPARMPAEVRAALNRARSR